jgi:pimeloyl-ACP methyl ester carboxylesterase
MKGMLLAFVAAGALFTAQPASADTVTSAGLAVHYSISGKGSPVVLLAGGPGFDPDYLKPVGAMLAAGHTVILIEQRGTGHSVPPTSDATTINEGLLVSDLSAERIARVPDTERLRPPHLQTPGTASRRHIALAPCELDSRDLDLPAGCLHGPSRSIGLAA